MSTSSATLPPRSIVLIATGIRRLFIPFAEPTVQYLASRTLSGAVPGNKLAAEVKRLCARRDARNSSQRRRVRRQQLSRLLGNFDLT